MHLYMAEIRELQSPHILVYQDTAITRDHRQQLSTQQLKEKPTKTDYNELPPNIRQIKPEAPFKVAWNGFWDFFSQEDSLHLFTLSLLLW